MNYLDLINIKYSFKKGVFVLAFLFLFDLVYILNLNMYESFTTYGYVQDNLINIKIPIEIPDIINELEYVKIGCKEYSAKLESLDEVMLDKENFVNYQIVKLKIDERLNDNEVFRLDIFYNEEKVYRKLKNILF